MRPVLDEESEGNKRPSEDQSVGHLAAHGLCLLVLPGTGGP